MAVSVILMLAFAQEVPPAPPAPAQPAPTVKSATPPADVTPLPAPDPAEGQVVVTRRTTRDIPIPRPRQADVPSYRVSVKLKNGRRFSGVVTRDTDFVASVQAGKHREAEIYESDDRFRLSYVDGLDGSIQLSWNRIARLDVREAFDMAGLKAMERSAFKARVQRRQELSRRRATVAAKEGSEGGEEDEPADEESPVELPALLQEFGPTEGWSPERREQITWRQTAIGVAPDEQEQRFLDVFGDWQPLYEAWLAEQAAAEAAGPKDAEGSGEDGEDADADKSDAEESEADKAAPAAKQSKAKPRQVKR